MDLPSRRWWMASRPTISNKMRARSITPKRRCSIHSIRTGSLQRMRANSARRRTCRIRTELAIRKKLRLRRWMDSFRWSTHSSWWLRIIYSSSGQLDWWRLRRIYRTRRLGRVDWPSGSTSTRIIRARNRFKSSLWIKMAIRRCIKWASTHNNRPIRSKLTNRLSWMSNSNLCIFRPTRSTDSWRRTAMTGRRRRSPWRSNSQPTIRSATRTIKSVRILPTTKLISRGGNYCLSTALRRTSRMQTLRMALVISLIILSRGRMFTIRNRIVSMCQIWRICRGRLRFKRRGTARKTVILEVQSRGRDSATTSRTD